MTHCIFTTATVSQQEVVGFSAIEQNYELLAKTLDPFEDKFQLLFYDLLTMDDLVEVQDAQEMGKKCACEKMLSLLLKSWKSDSFEKFLQVLYNCGYKECARQIHGKFMFFLFYLFVFLSTCLSVYQSVTVSVYLCIRLCVCLSVCPPPPPPPPLSLSTSPAFPLLLECLVHSVSSYCHCTQQNPVKCA